ncbi:MAG: 2OG-Fe dioxygenase family protein [Betaproteobacteria bacterium]
MNDRLPEARGGIDTDPAAAAAPLGWSLHSDDPAAALRRQGFVLLDAAALAQMAQAAPAPLTAAWDDLPPDAHLRDGGAYRFRRHASYTLDLPAQLARVPHRAHWQPTDYNALHGGIERWFEPVHAALDAQPAWTGLLAALGRVFAAAAATPVTRWYVEAHQFRIDTAQGIGRPTPEGAHRDGVDFVAVVLVQRQAVRGGETRVFQADAPFGVRFTLAQPWSALLLDDAHVVHETTPIQSAAAPGACAGWRDTLVLTYRRDRFQDPSR